MKNMSIMGKMLTTASRIFAVLVVSFSAVAENTAIQPVPKTSDRWKARHEAMNARVKEGNVDLLWIGDSIVENWEHQGKPVWDSYYDYRNAVNLGISGDRTENVLWRLDHGNIDGISPKLAIVMIGQNNSGGKTPNTAEEIAEGVTAVVQRLRTKLPETKILLLAIFYRHEKPCEERETLAKANKIMSKLADGKKIFYMDIDKIFLRKDGTIPATLMPDFEHPSEQGHLVWAKAIESKVKKLMGERCNCNNY